MPRTKKSATTKEEVKPKIEEIKEPVVVTNSEEDEEIVIPEEALEESKDGKEKYFESVGRRKEAVARVRLYTKKSTDAAKDEHALIIVNDKDYADYFLDSNLIIRIESPLKRLKSLNRFKAVVLVKGGGKSGQADAVRHGLARALEKFDANFRKKLKKAGFLTRDPRIKERRKYGKKRKARKSPQWSKR
jgi:small subunit ribosomal protein S9